MGCSTYLGLGWRYQPPAPGHPTFICDIGINSMNWNYFTCRRVGLLRRGENQRTKRKISQSKDENQQQTQPTHDAKSGNRTRATLYWWEASPLRTAPSLLSCYQQVELRNILISLTFLTS